MSLLIKNATIIDPNSSFHKKKMDLLIEKGKIVKIAKDITVKAKKTVTHKNLHVSPGWFDLRAKFQDPGFEYKEDLMSGIRAAARGGFTAVLSSAETFPPIDNKSGVEYIINKTKGQVVDVLPLGSVTEKLEGKAIAEMNDMHQSGAIAFSDGKHSISNPNILKRALLYTKAFNGLVIHFSQDAQLSNKGQVHEGIESTKLGLRGIPSIAEEISVKRDIDLLDYTDSKLHLSTISSGKTVDLIKDAKKKKLRLSADVAAINLLLTDRELASFDSNLKVNPPLRTEEDRKKLIKGLKDGIIDAICSDHSPEDIDSKKCEFDLAEFGIVNLETAYAVANTALKNQLEVTEIIEKISINPRKILGLNIPSIKEGEMANLTFFDPDLEWTPQKEDFKSKSKNTPLIGRKLIGKALGIYNKGEYISNE